jgi:tetratricopeptide (TPR) repeat protein
MQDFSASIERGEPAASLPRDPKGQVLEQRFVLDELLALGQMGAVYRGTDRRTGRAVAIKLLATERQQAQRISQETAILAGFSHPAIVRHIAHGLTARDEPFLVMEWLEGEDLAARLARGPLSVEQSLQALRRACEGLVPVHAHGVAHRNLKPSNLFLVHGDPGALKVLEFGIAGSSDDGQALPRAGAAAGSLGYMSPEQAMGLRQLDPRSDVFALGCVLYECLTGRPAFGGPNRLAVLAKVLRDEPLRVAGSRPELCPALEALLVRMLSKEMELRPGDAAAVLRALDQLDSTVGASHGPVSLPHGLTAAEPEVVSVILGALGSSPTADAHGRREADDDQLSAIRAATREIGAVPIALRGGGLLVMVSDRGAAHDQAAQTAACALTLSSLRPHARWGVAMGQAETDARAPVAAAIDRAARLLDAARGHASGVAIDEPTAALLPPNFELKRDGARCQLLSRREGGFEARRLLLGKPAPFVGRYKELALLELTLRECLAESLPRVVVVVGPPGQGKSRLRQEFTATLTTDSRVRVLVARCDRVGAGASFGALRQILRQSAGLRESTAPSEQRATLQRRVTTICERSDAARVGDFLSELLGLHGSDPVCAELRAAREDPSLLGTWLERSFGEWLDAECKAQPTLIVLDDLHWGDLHSVGYLGDAIRSIRRPLMVLALARPELAKTFPNLWAAFPKVELELASLTQGPAKRLVRYVLGDAAPEELMRRIIEHGDGNPLYVEELLRQAVNGHAGELPLNVRTLVQSRLERLPDEERRVVCAASVFGAVFWRGGLAAVLGSSVSAQELNGWLDTLIRSELVAVAPDSRFEWECAYSFRHELFREAAYGMLSPQDRARGHARAGEWLAKAGEKDALLLAEHFESGGEPSRAVPWILQAARIALDSRNLDATLRLAERATRCDADLEQLGVFAWMRAAVLARRGDLRAAATASQEALRALTPGSCEWFQSAGNLFMAAAFLGDTSVATVSLHSVLTTPPKQPRSGAYSWAMCAVCSALTSSGDLGAARSVLARTEAMLDPAAAESDPAFVMNLRIARGGVELVTGELAPALRSLAEGRSLADRLELTTQRAMSRYLLAATYAQVGSTEHIYAVARELDEICGPDRWFYSDRISAERATLLADAGRAEQAVARCMPLLESSDQQLRVSVRTRLAYALFIRGDMDAATTYAREAFDHAARFSDVSASALSVLALVALAQGQPADALKAAEEGLLGGARGTLLRTRSMLRLARAEALEALTRHNEACAEIRLAREQFCTVRASLPDAALRASFGALRANARTLALAERWLGA